MFQWTTYMCVWWLYNYMYLHVILTKLWLQGAKFLFFLLSWPPSFLFSYFVSDIILSLMVLFLQCFIECWATTPMILYYFIMVLTFLVLLLLLQFPFEPLRITDFPDSLSCLSPADHSWSFCWWCTCTL